MGVGADEGLAGLAEPLQMYLMADAVAGTGEVNAVLSGDSLQVTVIVAVFKAALQGVVVHIGNAQFGFDPGDTHGLKLQICHGAGGVLGQGLVDPQSNLAARSHIPGNQVIFDDFLRNGHAHISNLL